MGMSKGLCARRIGLPAALAWFGLGLLVPAACGGPQEAVGKGESCFRADDCAAGLVCINGVCDDDLSKIVSKVDGPAPPPDGAGGTGGADEDSGGSDTGAGGSTGGSGGATG